MKLIDLYITEVGRHLPAKNREDIEKEIRSMIEDMLDEQTGGQEPSEDQVVEVLTKLGPPDKIAESYQPARYLIGPELFPSFVTTARIVLAITIFFSLLGMGVSLGKSAPGLESFAEGLFEAFANLIQSLFTSLGVVVLIFGLIQWFAPKVKSTTTPWDPRKMKAVPDGDRVKIGEAVTEIVFSALAIILFNFFPQYVGAGFINNDGSWTIGLVSALTDSFFRLLPWFTLVWGLEILLNVALIALGRWQTATHWIDVAIKVLSLAVAYAVITAEPLFGFTEQALLQAGWPADVAQAFAETQPLFYTLFRVAVGIGMAAGVFELGKKLYNLLLKDRMTFASIEG